MESGPSKIAEALVYWLLPPACREEILGDMRERNQGSAQFLIEATCTVPSMIYSRIRRTTDAVVALMQAVSLYTAYVMSALWLNRDLLLRGYGFSRLAVPTAICLLAIMLGDAYSDPKKRSPCRILFGPTVGIALTYTLELNHGWALPMPTLAWGGAFGFFTVSTLRLTFPPATERSQTVAVPAFWQKVELLSPSWSLRNALARCAVLLAIILFLLLSHHL
jgi:hypothetical protein